MANKWEDFTYAGSPIRRAMTIENGNLTTVCQQDNIQDCLDANVADHNETTDGNYNAASGWTKVASIPLWLLEKWKTEEGLDWYRWNEDDKVGIIRKLNDIEYLKLRTRKGKI